MKFRKMILAGAFLVALTASFAFKAEKKRFLTTASVWDSTRHLECISSLITQDDCTTFNMGAQCTAYWNPTHPNEPAYSNGFPPCTSPLYHEF